MKRKEKEYELEMQRLAKEKITLQERIQSLKSELAKMNIEVDLNQWITLPDEQDTNSTSTATGNLLQYVVLTSHSGVQKLRIYLY